MQSLFVQQAWQNKAIWNHAPTHLGYCRGHCYWLGIRNVYKLCTRTGQIRMTRHTWIKSHHLAQPRYYCHLSAPTPNPSHPTYPWPWVGLFTTSPSLIVPIWTCWLCLYTLRKSESKFTKAPLVKLTFDLLAKYSFRWWHFSRSRCFSKFWRKFCRFVMILRLCCSS